MRLSHRAALDVSQPNVSQHLRVLRAAGVVESRREGSWIHYRIAEGRDPAAARIVAAALAGAAPAEDQARLQTARGAVRCE